VQYPSNAVFYIDGEQRLSANNTFTVDKAFELELKNPTDSPVLISLEEDNQALADEIDSFVDSYNRIVDFAKKSSEKFSGGGKLLNEFERIARSYTDVLNSSGFDVKEDGSIELNSEGKENLKDAQSVNNVLSQMEGFRNSVMRHADSMMSNPMEYLDKKVVAYKNPARSFASPYSSSTYAGIMFDGYY
jgi:flagellar hook-associated protein 2